MELPGWICGVADLLVGGVRVGGPDSVTADGSDMGGELVERAGAELGRTKVDGCGCAGGLANLTESGLAAVFPSGDSIGRD